MAGKHIHLHLGELESGDEIHLHFAGPAANIGAPASANNDPEAAMLRRMKAYANADNVQAIYDGLVARSLVPHIPAVRKLGGTPQAYLRWAGESGSTLLYQNTASVQIIGAGIVQKLGSLPGATVRRGTLYFGIATEDQVNQALAAVDAALA